MPGEVGTGAVGTGVRVASDTGYSNGLGTIRVMVEPYAASRYGSLALVDMKAEKKIIIDKLQINASLDVFNLFNSNTVLNRVTTQNSATANRVTEVTGPRVLRFGLRFTF